MGKKHTKVFSHLFYFNFDKIKKKNKDRDEIIYNIYKTFSTI